MNFDLNENLRYGGGFSSSLRSKHRDGKGPNGNTLHRSYITPYGISKYGGNIKLSESVKYGMKLV